MKRITFIAGSAAALLSLAASALPQEKPASTLAAVKMVVTVEGDKDKNPPDLKREDVVVTLGKERLQVTGWTPAKDENAGLAFFLVVDDASDTSLGGLLDDVRVFIQAQPATTLVGVAYMNNNTVSIAQDLTNDHAKASKALRIPLGNPGAHGSPYLSVRREKVLIHSG